MSRRRFGRAMRGFSLIELMVAVIVGMLLTAAAFSVLRTSESRKRTMSSVNDINQAGGYSLYLIDHWVRSAGTGLVQAADYTYGCLIYASKSSSQILPRSTALPAPFAAVTTPISGNFRVAPVVIFPSGTTPGVSGQGSDVLMVMGSGSGTTVMPTPFGDEAATSQLTLANSVGYKGGDLVLVADQQPADAGGPRNCMVQQVSTGFSGGSATALTLGGSYAAGSVDSQNITDFTPDGLAINLGGSSGADPAFLVIGVGDNDVLYTYDLLGNESVSLARAEGVFEMKALYGIDSNDDGTISASEWASPSTTGYTPASLLDGSATANKKLRRIKAVRVGLILRTSLPEKASSPQSPGATSITLFDDLSLKYTRSFSAAERKYRYRKVELTIPVRNNLLIS